MNPQVSIRETQTLGIALLLMPSTHGLISWSVWLLLYQVKWVSWNPTVGQANIAFAGVLASFAVASLCFIGPFRVFAAQFPARVYSWQFSSTPMYKWRYILTLHTLGFFGIGIYIRDFSNALGGLPSFIAALLGSSYLIRWQAEHTSSIGTQLSYFGWIAIALTALELRRRSIDRWWIVAMFLQFSGNFLFIDRTRPTWILYTGLLLFSLGETQRKLIWRGTLFALISFFLFVGIALWVGKITYRLGSDSSGILMVLRNLYIYGTGGFAYFNHIIQVEYPADGAFARSFYPLFRFTAALGLTESPPSQINDFYWMPVPTNVGTFLEPLYRDGGWMWLAIGVLVHAFGFNAISILLLKSERPLALFAWANLCFVTFICFFTPKFNNLPVWLFTGIGVASMLVAAASSKPGLGDPAPPYIPTPGGQNRA